MGFQIAIDGPVGSGKSSVSRELARRLGFAHIDTGAMYRAAGLFATRRGAGLFDEAAVSALLPEISISVNHCDGVQLIFLNGEDVSREIRTQAASNAASKVSAFPAVREKLVELQRRLAEKTDVVMDGRDIGTHVLPDADLKIYLDAPPEIRAERRFKELLPANPELSLEAVIKETVERDDFDSNREHSPLRRAPGAVLINVGGMSLAGVVDEIYALAARKRKSL